MAKVALQNLSPMTKRPSPIKGDATKFVINHWLKPVAWLVLEHIPLLLTNGLMCDIMLASHRKAHIFCSNAEQNFQGGA